MLVPLFLRMLLLAALGALTLMFSELASESSLTLSYSISIRVLAILSVIFSLSS